jgi:hypothetical protein
MKQGYNARLDESLGAKNGKKSQSLKDRRDESKAMSKKDYGHAYGGALPKKCKRTFRKINKKISMLNGKSKGLGDTIEKITTATGIKKVVDKVAKATGKPCGCSERRDSLNRKFPYSK